MKKLKTKIETSKEFQRFKGDRPVKEAPGILMVTPLAEDIKNAIPKDFMQCAYAVCLKRQGATDVFMYATKAYVGTVDKKGKDVIYRYELRAAARKFIRAFDRRENPTSATFCLYPAAKSNTLEARRQRIRQLRSEPYRPNPKPYKRTKPRMLTAGVRNGTGMVHFTTHVYGLTPPGFQHITK
jgi:hypothetical protein